MGARIILLLFSFRTFFAAKLRNWMGPTIFLEGPIPIERLGHGLAAYGDNKIMIFGGTNAFYGDNARALCSTFFGDSWFVFLRALLNTNQILRVGRFNDLLVLDVATSTWIDLSTSTSGPVPAPRAFHGFVNLGERFFVHGGLALDLGRAYLCFLRVMYQAEFCT